MSSDLSRHRNTCLLGVRRQEELRFSLGGNIKLKHPISLRSLIHWKAEVDASNQHLSELIFSRGRRVSISVELGHSLPESIWFRLVPSRVAVNRLHRKERKNSSLYHFLFWRASLLHRNTLWRFMMTAESGQSVLSFERLFVHLIFSPLKCFFF